MPSYALWRFRARQARIASTALPIAVSLASCICLAGCGISRLNKQANAISGSLAPVVDQSAVAYRGAVSIHNLREGYEAVEAYQHNDTSFNPRNLPVLLPEKDIQARLAVLAALEVYSKSLIEITRSADSPELEAASKSAGNDLTSLGNDLAPSIENDLGIAASGATTTTTVTTVSASGSSTSSTTISSPALSPQVRNGISTAVDALGQYLVGRKAANELPAKIAEMDPVIQLFCKTLADDISALDDIEQRDYDRILNLEKQFVLEDKQRFDNPQPGSSVDPEAWRAEVMKLPDIAREQHDAHDRLMALREALNNLALTHRSAAIASQHANPESLKEKLTDLSSAGGTLGKFYSALPAK